MKRLLLILLWVALMGVTFPDPVTITIYDRHGHLVETRTIRQGSGKKVALVMEGIQPGLYIVKVHGETHTQVYRLRVR